MGNKYKLIVDDNCGKQTSRNHPLPCIRWGGAGAERGGKGQVDKVYSFSTLKMVKKVLKAASF